MEVEQPPVIIETSKMVKSRVIEELDDNLEGGNPCNGNNLSSFLNGIHDGNGHGHVGRSLSVGDSIPEEDEEELDLEELENTAVDINGAGQRKGHRSGSFASTGKLSLSFKEEILTIALTATLIMIYFILLIKKKSYILEYYSSRIRKI